jgi:hypothetical protein
VVLIAVDVVAEVAVVYAVVVALLLAVRGAPALPVPVLVTVVVLVDEAVIKAGGRAQSL